MRFLDMVEAYAGRLEPIDSPRGESIFVTWSPKTFIEASAWRAYPANRLTLQRLGYGEWTVSAAWRQVYRPKKPA